MLAYSPVVLLILFLTSIIVTLVVTFVVIWFLYIDKRIRCYIMTEYNESYKIIKIVKANPKNEKFTYKDNEFILDKDRMIFDTRNRPIIYYDVTDIHPIEITKKKIDESKSPKLLKKILESDIYGKIFGEKKFDIMMLFVVVGIAITACLAGYTFFIVNNLQLRIENIINLLTRTTVVK